MTGTNAHKDVIYIDVDDEITGIIDKLRSSKQKIVALVLPKRATVLQSVVNMKLLKRTADSSKKNVVLITSEAGLLPLAGSVGLHVAKTLGSKPEIPDGPSHGKDAEEAEVEEVADEGESKVDTSKTVGELAGATAVKDEMDEESIELGDEEDDAAPDTKDGKPKTAKTKGKFKIPNFNKFRMLLIVGGAAVMALIAFGVVALKVMPKASLTIKTDSTAVDSSSIITLKTAAGTALDVEKGVVPAQVQEVKKTLTQEVPATGQLNNGEKATGSIKFYNCSKNDTLEGKDRTIPAGTGVSVDGLTFVTATAVTVQPSNFAGDNCLKNKASNSVTMTAQKGGTQYNHVAATTYTVAGFPTMSGTGTETTGGTDNITKVVTQADIDSAKQKIGAQDIEPVKQELQTALIGRGLYAFDTTFSVGTPETKSSVEANAPAESVKVTQTINYSMMGASHDDLKKIIEQSVADDIDTTKQSISNYGIDKAVSSLQNNGPEGASVTLQTKVVAGPVLDAGEIKKLVAGKKAGEAKELIQSNPGVTSVDVKYSPFWVSSIPKNINKITVVIEEPQTTNSQDDTDN